MDEIESRRRDFDETAEHDRAKNTYSGTSEAGNDGPDETPADIVTPPLVLDPGTRVNSSRRAARKAAQQVSTPPSGQAPEQSESAEQEAPRRGRIILTPLKSTRSPIETRPAAGRHEKGEQPPKGPESRAQPQDRPWALKPMFTRQRQTVIPKTEPAMRRNADGADGEGGQPAASDMPPLRGWPRRGSPAYGVDTDQPAEDETTSTGSKASERRWPSEPPLTLVCPLSHDDDEPPLRARTHGWQERRAERREASAGITAGPDSEEADAEPAGQPEPPAATESHADKGAPAASGMTRGQAPAPDEQADAEVAAPVQAQAPRPNLAETESAGETKPADAPAARASEKVPADTPVASVSPDAPEDAVDGTCPPEAADHLSGAAAEDTDDTVAPESADAADIAGVPDPSAAIASPGDNGDAQAPPDSSGDANVTHIAPLTDPEADTHGISGGEAAGSPAAVDPEEPEDDGALESADTPVTLEAADTPPVTEPAGDDGEPDAAPDADSPENAVTAPTAPLPEAGDMSPPETTETASIGPMEAGGTGQSDVAAAPETAPDDPESATADGAAETDKSPAEAGLANTAEAEEPGSLAGAPTETQEHPDPPSEEMRDTGSVVFAVPRESTRGGADRVSAETPAPSPSEPEPEPEAPGPAVEPEDDDAAMEARVLAEVARELERRALEAAEAMDDGPSPEPGADAGAQPADTPDPEPEPETEPEQIDVVALPADKTELRDMVREIVRQELSSAIAGEIDRRVQSVVTERLSQAFAPRPGV